MLNRGDVVLRPWRDSDLAFFAGLRNDVETQRQLMSRARGSSASATRAWLERRSSDPHGLFFVIARGGDNHEAAGFIQLAKINGESRAGALGICIAREYQGTGAAAAALALLMDHARSALNLRKITLEVLADNTRGRAFYRKNGFREVGVLEAEFEWNHCWSDVILMERMLVR